MRCSASVTSRPWQTFIYSHKILVLFRCGHIVRFGGFVQYIYISPASDNLHNSYYTTYIQRYNHKTNNAPEMPRGPFLLVDSSYYTDIRLMQIVWVIIRMHCFSANWVEIGYDCGSSLFGAIPKMPFMNLLDTENCSLVTIFCQVNRGFYLWKISIVSGYSLGAMGDVMD